jgi:hypothetical protein
MNSDTYKDILELLHFLQFHHVSLVQWTNHLLPATGGSGSHPRVATHTRKLGLPVSANPLLCDPDVFPDHWLL